MPTLQLATERRVGNAYATIRPIRSVKEDHCAN